MTKERKDNIAVFSVIGFFGFVMGESIIIDGCLVLNPTEQQLAEQEWVKVVPPHHHGYGSIC